MDQLAINRWWWCKWSNIGQVRQSLSSSRFTIRGQWDDAKSCQAFHPVSGFNDCLQHYSMIFGHLTLAASRKKDGVCTVKLQLWTKNTNCTNSCLSNSNIIGDQCIRKKSLMRCGTNMLTCTSWAKWIFPWSNSSHSVSRSSSLTNSRLVPCPCSQHTFRILLDLSSQWGCFSIAISSNIRMPWSAGCAGTPRFSRTPLRQAAMHQCYVWTIRKRTIAYHSGLLYDL